MNRNNYYKIKGRDEWRRIKLALISRGEPIVCREYYNHINNFLYFHPIPGEIYGWRFVCMCDDKSFMKKSNPNVTLGVVDFTLKCSLNNLQI